MASKRKKKTKKSRKRVATKRTKRKKAKKPRKRVTAKRSKRKKRAKKSKKRATKKRGRKRAKRKTKKKASATARTTAKRAGKPKKSSARRAFAAAAAAAGPSAEQLDLRDRLKSGPRRQAGPPLSGDMPSPFAMRALREEVVPAATDPTSTKRKRSKRK